MDINQFQLSLLHSLSSLDFVKTVDFHTEVFILTGRAVLTKNRFLHVYFNELTGAHSLCSCEDNKSLGDRF